MYIIILLLFFLKKRRGGGECRCERIQERGEASHTANETGLHS